MPLFKSSKKSAARGNAAAVGAAGSSLGSSGRAGQAQEPVDAQVFKYAPQLSKHHFDVGGLPINVFGLDELTPSSSRASAPPLPDISIAIHMHGRGGSADNEEGLVRHLYDRVRRSSQRTEGATREILLVNFDARNHGHRLTNEEGQTGWKQGNKRHALDLYAMIVGMAQDVSLLVDFLPAYLFPQDDRRVTQWIVTGKSLGGHASWHVLANDPRITIGVPFISCPSYAELIADRARTSFVTNGPPYVPASLSALISQIDPACQPHDSFDSNCNPFWGKKICMCSGAADKLVPWRCAETFVKNLVTGEPEGERGEMTGLRVVLLEGVGHTVTDEMIEEAGHWIYLHGVK